jgi:two-component sensor histidine kinase
MLNLQMRHTDSEHLHKVMRDIEMRIRSMALIHEHLYRSDDLDRIPLGEYLGSLTRIILSSMSGPNIELKTHFEQAEVSIETALPIGLITNELITNAFKYAYPGGESGIIEVSLSKNEQNELVLSIADQGIGLPPDFNFEEPATLGMFITRILVKQISGRIEIQNNGGTCFHIFFKDHEETSRKQSNQ